MTQLAGARRFVDETPALTPTEVRARARRLNRERGGLDLIVVDYLHLMRGSSNKENRATAISEISRSLKALAKELHVPVIALSQLNRAVEQRVDKRPVMSDLRESGGLEQYADVILLIYREDQYDQNTTLSIQSSRITHPKPMRRVYLDEDFRQELYNGGTRVNRRTLLQSALALPIVPPNASAQTPRTSVSRDSDASSLFSGLPGLDYALGGVRRHELICIVGPPSSGKTLLLLDLAARLCSRYGKNVMFYVGISRVSIWPRKAPSRLTLRMPLQMTRRSIGTPTQPTNGRR